MNALNREILTGERLVIKKECMREEYQELKYRVFIAESGFGLAPFTSGSLIYGCHEIDGKESSIRASVEISVEETEEVQRYKRDISLDQLVSLVEGEQS